MTTPDPIKAQREEAVYQMARVGLIEIAKDLRNSPAVVANHAAALDTWRTEIKNAAAAKIADLSK